MKKFIIPFILMTPVFFIATHLNPSLRLQQEQYAMILTVIALGAFIPNKYFGWFVLLATAHGFLFKTPLYASNLLIIASYAILYQIAYSYHGLKGYKVALASVLLINCFMAILQLFGLDVFFWVSHEAVGITTLPCYLGMITAISAPVLITLSPWFLIPCVFALILSKSLFCVLAFIVSVLFFFRWLKPWVLILGICLVITGGVYKYKNNDGWSERFHVWSMVGSKAFRNPFFGQGIGNYRNNIFAEYSFGKVRKFFQMELRDENMPVLAKKMESIAREFGFEMDDAGKMSYISAQDHLRAKGVNFYDWALNTPHNEYLYLFFEYGGLGLFLLAMYLKDIIERYRRINQDKDTRALMASLIAILIISIVHFPFGVTRTAVICIVLLATLDRRLK